MFCGKIPKELYEDELIPLFEKCGDVWDLRLMMDPLTGQNRGYAFVTFTSRAGADEAVATVSSSGSTQGCAIFVVLFGPVLPNSRKLPRFLLARRKVDLT